jgi:hypothetical protein
LGEFESVFSSHFKSSPFGIVLAAERRPSEAYLEECIAMSLKILTTVTLVSLTTFTACGGSSSKKSNDPKVGQTAKTQKTNLSNKQTGTDSTSNSSVVTPTSTAPYQNTNTVQQGQTQQGQTQQGQTQQGQIPLGVTQVGVAGYSRLALRFPKKIVGLPEETIQISGEKLLEAAPLMTEPTTIRGMFVPGGSRVEGALILKAGTVSLFQPQWIHMSNGSSIAVDGLGALTTQDTKTSDPTIGGIAGGALVGAGAAALLDRFVFGSSKIEWWSVAAGAVVGGLVGTQIFRDSDQVVVVPQNTGLVLGAR